MAPWVRLKSDRRIEGGLNTGHKDTHDLPDGVYVLLEDTELPLLSGLELCRARSAELVGELTETKAELAARDATIDQQYAQLQAMRSDLTDWSQMPADPQTMGAVYRETRRVLKRLGKPRFVKDAEGYINLRRLLDLDD